MTTSIVGGTIIFAS